LSARGLASHAAVLVALVAFGGRRLPPGASDAREPAIDDADPPGTDDDETAWGPEDGDLPMSAADGGPHVHPRSGCPSSMVRVGDSCIDRYEAPNVRGAEPLVMQSADDAVAWCASHRKRLCTEDEWIRACEGDEHRSYPYGREHVDGRCNDDKPWREVHEATLARWPAPEAREHARELYQATPSGRDRKCSSEAGVHDLTGNVEEWVVRTREHANPWPYLLAGCYWSGCYGGSKPTCHSTNDAHGPAFRFYETGFRCCRDANR
jgi:formylglycine-generating enzyme required for sulfatase activity